MNELLDIVFRASTAYLLLLLLTRIMGRKEISQLTFFDFVSGITFGSIAASTLVNPTMPVYLGIGALVVWAIWVLATARFTLLSLPARKIIEAEPLMVIHNGKIFEEKLAERHYNINDLLKQLREKSIFDPAQVEVGIIETDGKISILKKSQFQPVTIGENGKAATSASGSKMAGKEIIIDGKILNDNLAAARLNEEALSAYLKSNGIQNASEVELLIINPKGQYYLDLKKDKPNHT